MAYSMDLRQRIVAAVVEDGQRHAEVAQRFQVGIATVRRYLRRAQEGRLAAEPPPGRPPHITPAQYPALAAQVAAHNDASLHEHGARWAEQHGIAVSVSALCRTLQRARITRKKSRSAPPNQTRWPGRSGRRR
ncbi:MAG: transposase [Deinococcus sp.]|nr:transposase [Deinococcus sp.]